jgi:hypothetical protein
MVTDAAVDSQFRELLLRLDRLASRHRDLRDGVNKAIRIAEEDPEMALTRARKVLEYIVRIVYQQRINEPPGTRPLENLIQRLVKDGWFPTRLEAYATTVRKLGNVGTHSFEEPVSRADVYMSLTQLMPILEWFFENERPELAALPDQARARPQEPAVESQNGQPQDAPVVPKGLRSFSAEDSDFFLRLLPGPRDGEGLPESIRFWKNRIEASGEMTFSVGVLYGPSGCGKSSLIKAGLLPRLDSEVIRVYVESTADDTEFRLLDRLRRQCPSLPDGGLSESVAALRQGQALDGAGKVLLVLDQFEQYLHAAHDEHDSELVRTLRQCDGRRVQCLLLVRDDFWMAVTRFMRRLDIPLEEGKNTAAVDLFDPRHSAHVLAAFGRSYGALPPGDTPLSTAQQAFVRQAVAELAQDGRVIPVRLALFAEMVKARPWNAATLHELGGMEGVGVAFLEEAFSSRLAKDRLHQKAARAILESLLPPKGTDIKGHMRSRRELLEVSGYASCPAEFDDLMRMLDSEKRLLTPMDRAGTQPAGAESDGTKYYQLTHDYLVPALRQWLRGKQAETIRGRAELQLDERVALWSVKRDKRQLPSILEYYYFVAVFFGRRRWTDGQFQLLRASRHHHGFRVAIVALLVVTASLPPARVPGLHPILVPLLFLACYALFRLGVWLYRGGQQRLGLTPMSQSGYEELHLGVVMVLTFILSVAALAIWYLR